MVVGNTCQSVIKHALPITGGSGIDDADYENWWGAAGGPTNRAVVTIPALMVWVAVWRDTP